MKNIHYAWLIYIATYSITPWNVWFFNLNRNIRKVHIIWFPYFTIDLMICILIDRSGFKIVAQNGEKPNDSRKSNGNVIAEIIHRFWPIEWVFFHFSISSCRFASSTKSIKCIFRFSQNEQSRDSSPDIIGDNDDERLSTSAPAQSPRTDSDLERPQSSSMQIHNHQSMSQSCSGSAGSPSPGFR